MCTSELKGGLTVTPTEFNYSTPYPWNTLLDNTCMLITFWFNFKIRLQNTGVVKMCIFFYFYTVEILLRKYEISSIKMTFQK